MHTPDNEQDQPIEIRLEDLDRSFGPNHILRRVTLEIRRGEIIAIVGPSGCGKTVLMDHIIGLLKPDEGRVLVANHGDPDAPLVDLTRLNHDEKDEIRKHWAVVFQRNALFSGTVYDNIALWLREVRKLDDPAIQPIVHAALDAVGLEYDAVAPKDRDDLSGGMAKRVAIARALAMDPHLLFYDEPTTGLDPQHAALVHALIAEMHSRRLDDGSVRTTVMITHDKDLLARIEPRVVMLSEGRVFFDGPYRRFRESESDLIRPYLALMPLLQSRVPMHE